VSFCSKRYSRIYMLDKKEGEGEGEGEGSVSDPFNSIRSLGSSISMKKRFTILILLIVLINGCSYTTVRNHYLPEHNIQATPEGRRWIQLQPVAQKQMTGFMMGVLYGQIPGWLVAYEYLNFAIPSDQIKIGNVVPIITTNMWNVAGPYGDGTGQVTKGYIKINKITANKIVLEIKSEELKRLFNRSHKFSKNRRSKIDGYTVKGLVENEE
jgi:hypothetical protein